VKRKKNETCKRMPAIKTISFFLNGARFPLHRTVGLRERAARREGDVMEKSPQAGADMELRNSELVLVLVRRLRSSSIASTVESGLRTLRRTQTRLSSS